MTGNFVMLQMDDLRQVVTEIVEEVCAKRGLNEKPSEEEVEWLTREEVCDMLRITYTMEKPRAIAPLRQVRLTPDDKIELIPCI